MTSRTGIRMGITALIGGRTHVYAESVGGTEEFMREKQEKDA